MQSGEGHAHANLRRMAQDLQKATSCLTTTLEQAQRSAREAFADIFILESQLNREKIYQSEAVKTIIDIVGVEVMQEIQETFELADSQTCSIPDLHGEVVRRGRKRRRTSTSNYHVFTYKPVNLPRLDEYVTQDGGAARTILNYSSDGEGTDDTYSDSNGTEQDFIDDPYSYYDICNGRRRTPQDGLPEYNWARLSTDEDSSTDSSTKSISWRSILDFDNDSGSSDLEYEPPDWDLEEVWEIENAEPSQNWPMHPLFRFNFPEECKDWERALSADGLSTDDSEKEYFDPAVTQRSAEALAASLGPHLKRPYQTRNLRWPRALEEDEQQYQTRVVSAEREYQWNHVLQKLIIGVYPALNLDERLDLVLESDKEEFYFDDVVWRSFELVASPGVMANNVT